MRKLELIERVRWQDAQTSFPVGVQKKPFLRKAACMGSDTETPILEEKEHPKALAMSLRSLTLIPIGWDERGFSAIEEFFGEVGFSCGIIFGPDIRSREHPGKHSGPPCPRTIRQSTLAFRKCDLAHLGDQSAGKMIRISSGPFIWDLWIPTVLPPKVHASLARTFGYRRCFFRVPRAWKMVLDDLLRKLSKARTIKLDFQNSNRLNFPRLLCWPPHYSLLWYKAIDMEIHRGNVST
jgi:hypothetical protein